MMENIFSHCLEKSKVDRLRLSRSIGRCQILMAVHNPLHPQGSRLKLLESKLHCAFMNNAISTENGKHH